MKKYILSIFFIMFLILFVSYNNVYADGFFLDDLKVYDSTDTEISYDFYPDQHDIYLTVDSIITDISVSASVYENVYNSKIYIEHVLYDNGQKSQSYSLGYGDNEIQVRHENDLGMFMYYINIAREVPQEHLFLDNLMISSGTLNPAFDPDITNYTVNVPYNVNQISVSGTNFIPQDYEHVVESYFQINNDSTIFPLDNINKPTINLNVGENVVDIKFVLYKAYGNYERIYKTYTLTINRAENSNTGGGDGNPSGGGSGGITTPVFENQIDTTTKTAKITVTQATLDSLFNSIQVDENSKKLAVIQVPKIDNIYTYTTSLPTSLFKTSNEVGIKIETEIGTIIIRDTMLPDSLESNSNIGITISKIDKSSLTEVIQNQIGDKPVIGLNLTINDIVTEWNNPNSPVIVSIPYSPTEEELKNPEKIVVWYIDGGGRIVTIPNGKYDSTTGMVTFATTHFSNYAISYVDKTFVDVDENNDAKHAIEVLASKGITNGVGNNKFAPEKEITRADFITLLIRAFELNKLFETNFNDVEIGKYYYNTVGIARELKIVQGVGNNKFLPNRNLTGEEIKIIVENVLNVKKYAVENIDEILNTIDDTKYVTRAEMALVLYNLIK